MELNEYWRDIDDRLEVLLEKGHVKLPSLSSLDLCETNRAIQGSMRGLTFKELSDEHAAFLESVGLYTYLAPKLYQIATSAFGYKGKISNQYHIARRVDPGKSSEAYRSHFDSHLFTLVIPIHIPQQTSNDCNVGELIYFPRAREMPKTEVSNFASKLWNKRFASERGLARFARNKKLYECDFRDYRPLLFLGNTTLHANRPVSSECSSARLTLLAHFFDPGSSIGIGSIIRKLRGR